MLSGHCAPAVLALDRLALDRLSAERALLQVAVTAVTFSHPFRVRSAQRPQETADKHQPGDQGQRPFLGSDVVSETGGRRDHHAERDTAQRNEKDRTGSCAAAVARDERHDEVGTKPQQQPAKLVHDTPLKVFAGDVGTGPAIARAAGEG